jgi:hypothetical protein
MNRDMFGRIDVHKISDVHPLYGHGFRLHHTVKSIFSKVVNKIFDFTLTLCTGYGRFNREEFQ